MKLKADSHGSSVSAGWGAQEALTHKQQGQAIEERANVSQEPHEDCKLKNKGLSEPTTIPPR